MIELYKPCVNIRSDIQQYIALDFRAHWGERPPNLMWNNHTATFDFSSHKDKMALINETQLLNYHCAIVLKMWIKQKLNKYVKM